MASARANLGKQGSEGVQGSNPTSLSCYWLTVVLFVVLRPHRLVVVGGIDGNDHRVHETTTVGVSVPQVAGEEASSSHPMFRQTRRLMVKRL